jgi:hypothetical protein
MPDRAINTKSATGFMLVLIPAALTMSALFVAWPVILGVIVAIAGGNIWQSYEWAKTARSIDPVFQQLIIQNRGEISALDLSLRANVPGKVSDRYLVAKASEFGTGRRQHPDRGQVYYFVSISTLGQIFDDSEVEIPAIMPAMTPVVAFQQSNTPEAIPESILQFEARSSVHTPPAAMSLEPEAVPPQVAAPPEIAAATPTLEPLVTLSSSERLEPSRLSQDIDLITQASAATIAPSEVEPSPPPVDGVASPTSPLVLIIQSELAKRLDVHSSTIYKRRSEPNFTDWTRNRDPEGIAWGYAEATKEYYRVDS